MPHMITGARQLDHPRNKPAWTSPKVTKDQSVDFVLQWILGDRKPISLILCITKSAQMG